LYLKATLYGMGTSLVLNLILISIFKDKGAAVTLLITETLVSFIAYFFVWEKMKIRLNWSLALKALLASLLFLPVAAGLRSIHFLLLPGLLAAVLVSAVLYFAVQVFVFREPLVKGVIEEVVRRLK